MKNTKLTAKEKIMLTAKRNFIPRVKTINLGKFLNEYTDNPKYHFSNFEFLKLGDNHHVVGRGAFGDVLLAKNKLDCRIYAIKQMNIDKVVLNGGSRDLILREITIHRRLIHQNIVRLYSHYEDETNFYLIMDYVNKGTLYQMIKLNNGLDEETAYKYFHQVVKAVGFLHENNLIHRDIKPENILINDKGEAKLCDFGWCIDVKIGNRVTFCGTFEYMAPEVFKELPYNQGVDVWSLGVLLYELIHGYSPFKGGANEEPRFIFENITKRALTIDQKVSNECADLIKNLLQIDNHKRIQVKEIFKHPWMKKFNKDEDSVNLKRINYKKEFHDYTFANDHNRIKNEIGLNFPKEDDSLSNTLLNHSTSIKPHRDHGNLSPLLDKSIQQINDDGSLFSAVMSKITNKNKKKRITREKFPSIEGQRNCFTVESNYDSNRRVKEIFEFDDMNDFKGVEVEKEKTQENNFNRESDFDLDLKPLKQEEPGDTCVSCVPNILRESYLMKRESTKPTRQSKLSNKEIITEYIPSSCFTSYDSYIVRRNLNTSAIELLERANFDRNKIADSTPVKEEKSFWSKIGRIFKPFKCDTK